jgi:hypothetical protein
VPGELDGRILVRFVSREGVSAEKAFAAADFNPLARPSGPGGRDPSPPPVPDYRPFPVHALPPVVREFVQEVAESVGCDPAFAALPALVVAGAAVGAALVVRPKRGYEQPPLLWLCAVGDSGTGKTPAGKPAADRAFAIDRRLKDEYQTAVRKACPRWTDRELSADTERRLADVLDVFRRLPFDPRTGPGRVSLDVPALARFKRLNDEFVATAENLDGGPMAAVLAKAVRFALRLALVWWCVAEAAAGRDPGKGCVPDAAMAAGEELARWFVHEAERVYAVLAELPEQRAERTLAEWVRRKGGSVRPRDLQRSNKRRYPTAAAELALDGLTSAGFGVWEDDPPPLGGGEAADTRPDSGDETPWFLTPDGRASAGVGRRLDTPDRRVGEAAGGPEPGQASDGPACPAWDDWELFFTLMRSRGWGWSGVLAWLAAPPRAGFFELTTDQRRRAAEHLGRLPAAAPPAVPS